ncbi:MAG: EcoAI/FtnUII family type I restriction enzme subunit R [Phycisphaerales bacterium JB052]
MSRNEAETRAELIDPALKAAGWGVAPSQVRREFITLGRLIGAGRRGPNDVADYVLIYNERKLAVIEAKKELAGVTEGLGQAKRYAQKIQARFAFSTNGKGIYRVDMKTGEEGLVECYPTPDEMWSSAFDKPNQWRDTFGRVPFEDKGGQWQPRYYQHNAVTNALAAIEQGRDRILLTLATGTGKTPIAFQIAWKLFQSRWNITDWRRGDAAQTRQPRILFLADRNILADQAFNTFGAFPDDAMVRIDPETIRKKGHVPKNGHIFFTIFQTFMTGRGPDGEPVPNFGDYPPDFFDLIIVDECHRGGAHDESTWRAILEYFSPAVQLGLTATPKRKNNADTYAYFGEPVYTYSLKDGINDGYLTPFKVRQIQTTLDEYIYTSDDEVLEGEIEEGRRYKEDDFNRIIEIAEREEARVKIYMDEVDQRQKSLVFCATQEHAAAVRDLINQMKASSDPDYCVRVTANDGAAGEHFLRKFQDNEKTIPTVLTTSRKLSTGVDARNVRHIVLLRPIKSMIEFKQIIGRGTRLYDDKDHFTIWDFVKAYENFNDPEWDGPPDEPAPSSPRAPREPGPDDDPGPDETPEPRQRTRVKLADGKERLIEHMSSTSFWSPEGRPLSAVEFIKRLFGELPDLFETEEELRELWSQPATRRGVMEGLVERGYSKQQLGDISRMINAADSDLFDVLAYIAFATPPVSRAERVESHQPLIASSYDGAQREFVEFVLDHYVSHGVGELDDSKLPSLLDLRYQSVDDAVRSLGSVSDIRSTFVDFQRLLYMSIAT